MKMALSTLLILCWHFSFSQHNNARIRTIEDFSNIEVEYTKTIKYDEAGRIRIVPIDPTTSTAFDLYLDGKKVTKYTLTATDMDGGISESKEVLVMINTYRKKNKVRPLIWDNKCYNTSVNYATFISHDLFFDGHQPTRPNHLSEEAAKELDDRLSAYCGRFGRDFTFCTENITTMTFSCEPTEFKSVVGAERIFISWKESAPHNLGMLDGRANVGAVGIHTTIYGLKVGKEVFTFYKKTAVYNAIYIKRDINPYEGRGKQVKVRLRVLKTNT